MRKEGMRARALGPLFGRLGASPLDNLGDQTRSFHLTRKVNLAGRFRIFTVLPAILISFQASIASLPRSPSSVGALFPQLSKH